MDLDHDGSIGIYAYAIKLSAGCNRTQHEMSLKEGLSCAIV